MVGMPSVYMFIEATSCIMPLTKIAGEHTRLSKIPQSNPLLAILKIKINAT